jgi:hypothetical protein
VAEPLKTCPFCGGKAEITPDATRWTVGCGTYECIANHIVVAYARRSEAASAWNTRVEHERDPLAARRVRERDKYERQATFSRHPPTKGDEALADEFSVLKRYYPRRGGNQRWVDAERFYMGLRKAGSTADELLGAVKRYAAYCDAMDNVGSEFVMQCATFFGRNKPYLERWDLPETKAQRARAVEDTRLEKLTGHYRSKGFRAPTPVESADAYETAAKLWLRSKP